MTSARWTMLPLILLLVISFAVRPAFGDVFYVYDELGRLVVVMDSNGDAAQYNYDAVGNILSITRFTAQGPPALTGIVPLQGELGSRLRITLTGQNLISTQAITSDNPGVGIQAPSVTAVALEQQLTAFVSIAAEAALGSGTLTVRTPFGSASIGFTVTQPPVVLTALVPSAGRVGDQVTIQGSGLTLFAGLTSVTFAGPGETHVPAPLIQPATPTELIVQVPDGVVTGPVEVAVGPISNSLPFTFITFIEDATS